MAGFVGQFKVCSLLEPSRWKSPSEKWTQIWGQVSVCNWVFVSNPVWKPLWDCASVNENESLIHSCVLALLSQLLKRGIHSYSHCHWWQAHIKLLLPPFYFVFIVTYLLSVCVCFIHFPLICVTATRILALPTNAFPLFTMFFIAFLRFMRRTALFKKK